MSEPTPEIVEQEITPEQLQTQPPETEWFNERLAHAKQQRFYRKVIFWGAASICTALYILFFGFIALLFFSTIAMQMFLSHSHFVAVFMALLVVPSAILWGLVRATFKIESQQNPTDIVKAITSFHPTSIN